MGPSGGASTNRGGDGAQDGSGHSSFPKGTEIFSVFLTAGTAWPACVG